MKRIFAIAILFFLTTYQSIAQCPMCRSAVESSMKGASTKSVGMGLNSGIIMLLIIVYTVIFTTGILWYLKYRKSQKHVQANS